MKKFSILLIAVSALLSGCVVYDTPYRESGEYRRDRRGEGDRDRDRDRVPNRADHDRDGVPDRQDNRPNDPRRY